MLKLYLGNVNSIISTLLIIAFGTFLTRCNSITHWGLVVLLIFFLGLSMSLFSGFRDGIGSASQLIPTNHWTMTVLSILGGLAFLAAILSLFINKPVFRQTSVYILLGIIIVKIILTEGFRIWYYVRHLG